MNFSSVSGKTERRAVYDDMRLTMTMKRPAFFPEIDPAAVLPSGKKCSLPEALETYGNALLECNEACLEASESALDIVRALRRTHTGFIITKCGKDAFTITRGILSTTLEGNTQEQVILRFSPLQKGIELSDFGPKDAAGLICAVFSSFDRIAAAVDILNRCPGSSLDS